MAEAGKTPIQLYHSTVTTHVPSAANLLPGELALNITDNKMWTDDGTGAIKQILGSLGAQDASNVTITGGTISNVTIVAPDLPFVTLEAQVSNPPAADTFGVVFVKEELGVTNLYYKNDAGDVIKLTSGNSLNVSLPTTTIAPENTITNTKTYSAYYRGKTVTVPIVSTVATIDWLAGTTFLINPSSQTFSIDFTNMPDPSLNESQVVWIVFENTGTCAISALNPELGFTIYKPSGTAALGGLTANGIDVYVLDLHAAYKLHVYPVFNMIEIDD